MLENDDLLHEYHATGRPALRLYEPAGLRIVLGAGRTAEADVDLQASAADGVPVVRRRGGGGTVLLSPGQAVLALVTEVGSPFRNREYALHIGAWWETALGRLGVGAVEPRGISDLAIQGRKILGTSIYRSKGILFYQASLLVDLPLRLLTRYLRYPNRVPDYRAGRSHEEFCTTLAAEGYRGDVNRVLEEMTAVTGAELPRLI